MDGEPLTFTGRNGNLLATLVVARLSEQRSYRRMLDRAGGHEG